MTQRVAVVGGGITGLSACYFLEKLGLENVTLFESNKRLGGKLQTEQDSGYLVEAGPDSIFVRRREITDFIEELQLENEVIEPKAKGFSIYLQDALRPIPPGLTKIGNIDAKALEEFEYLSDGGKALAVQEGSVKPNLSEDESVGDFFRRRFGREYAIKIAEPLYAGTHGGGSQHLSMQSLYPDLRDQERQYGSLRAASLVVAPAGPARFISFKQGCMALTARIAEKLRHTRVVERTVSKLAAMTLDGEPFDAVILAVPSYHAAKICRAAHPETTALLESIEFSSSIIATFGYESSDQELGLAGTGFLVPEDCETDLRGATWSSNKWNHRSTPSRSLLRVFLRWQSASDENLLALARSELSRMAGIAAEPTFCQIVRWEKGLPQYRIGHGKLVEEIEARFRSVGRIVIAGQSYRGVGIPDCVRQGREAAESVAGS